MVHKPGGRGYALMIVLFLMALLFILTTSFSLKVKTGTKEGLLIVAEQEALSAADSGIQYALETIRENQILSGSYIGASWNLLQYQNGVSACFKVFADGCHSSPLSIRSYGEVVEGNCGDYSGDLDRVLSVRIAEGIVDPQKGVLLSWNEFFPGESVCP